MLQGTTGLTRTLAPLCEENGTPFSCAYDAEAVVRFADVSPISYGEDGVGYRPLSISDGSRTLRAYAPAADWPVEPPKSGEEYWVRLRAQRDHQGLTRFLVWPAARKGSAVAAVLHEVGGMERLSYEDLFRLRALYQGFTVGSYRTFLSHVLQDLEFTRRFLTIPASKSCHHTSQGGLLKHSVEVAEGVEGMLSKIGVERVGLEAAMLTGLLHDVGKVVLDQEGPTHSCRSRDHERLIEEALRSPLMALQKEDREAYHALMQVIRGYVHGDSYAVPTGEAVRTADRVSAWRDQDKSSDEPVWKNWRKGCGDNHYWVPRPRQAG